MAENLEILNVYREYIDMVELRADFLESNERLMVRRFPQMAGIPCLLTFRRRIDGGQFVEGEAARTVLFARALSFADTDKTKNFEYVDFEEDFHVPSLQDAALAFGTRIVRSVHDMEKPIPNICERLNSLRTTGYEIPKIAFMPHSLEDVQRLFADAATLKDSNHILLAMGPLGVPSRILAAKLKNYLTFASPQESASRLPKLSHIDPVTLRMVYHFSSITEQSDVYGITGWPLRATSSPSLHNKGYEKLGINAVYIPICSERFDQALSFADSIGVRGLSVTVPHKEAVLPLVEDCDEKVRTIGASNTIVKRDGVWHAYNTDASGFSRALQEFTGLKSLRGKKLAIIGAGGAAKAIAYAVKELHGKACVFNRTVPKAKLLAQKYGFDYAPLSPDTEQLRLFKKYSSIIIQTTSKGMGCEGASTEENDPIFFYEFSGKELLFDIIYVPEVTPVMARAAAAGCKVCNGYDMLRYQGFEQFALFTGKEYADGNH